MLREILCVTVKRHLQEWTVRYAPFSACIALINKNLVFAGKFTSMRFSVRRKSTTGAGALQRLRRLYL